METVREIEVAVAALVDHKPFVNAVEAEYPRSVDRLEVEIPGASARQQDRAYVSSGQRFGIARYGTVDFQLSVAIAVPVIDIILSVVVDGVAAPYPVAEILPAEKPKPPSVDLRQASEPCLLSSVPRTALVKEPHFAVRSHAGCTVEQVQFVAGAGLAVSDHRIGRILGPRSGRFEIVHLLREQADLVVVESVGVVAAAADVHAPFAVRRLCRGQDGCVGDMFAAPVGHIGPISQDGAVADALASAFRTCCPGP